MLDNSLLNMSLIENLGALSTNPNIENTTRSITPEEKDNINKANSFIYEMLTSWEEDAFSGDFEKPAEINSLIVKFKETDNTKSYAKNIVVWCQGENDEDLCVVSYDDVIGDEVTVYNDFGTWFSSELRFTYRVFGG